MNDYTREQARLRNLVTTKHLIPNLIIAVKYGEAMDTSGDKDTPLVDLQRHY